DTSDLESNLGFIRTFLLVFAYVALVVGAFIIFNTFSITVAQRTREFGLLRTLGSSRRQIMQSVVYEGLLLGVGGAVLGLLGGLLVLLLILAVVYVVRMLVRVRRGGGPPRYRLVPALARAIGVLVSWRGITGQLARENSIRQPGRTMITAAALTVGLALVAFV